MSAYPSLPGPTAPARGFLADIGRRKEFYEAANPVAASEPAFELPGEAGHLKLQGHQKFVAGFQSPGTPYRRLVLNWPPGLGKTIGALTIAAGFVRGFDAGAKSALERAGRPGVHWIGWTREIVYADALRFPEFGFASVRELAELQRLEALAATGGDAVQRTAAAYRGALRRRLTDRDRGGFFTFWGYKEFANRLFEVTPSGEAAGFDAAALYTRGPREIPRGRRKPAQVRSFLPSFYDDLVPARDDLETARKRPVDPDDEDLEPADDLAAADVPVSSTFVAFRAALETAIEAGYVRLNIALLETIRGGLIVCDEMQNTYNARAKNNYGVAVQFALEYWRLAAPKDVAATPRFLGLTATPLNHSVLEEIDFLDFLLEGGPPPETLFQIAKNGRPAATPTGLALIREAIAGRIAYARVRPGDPAYPVRRLEGAPLKLAPVLVQSLGKTASPVRYLRFDRVPLSEFHERTLRAAIVSGGLPRVPAGGAALNLIAFPRPPNYAGSPPDTGLFRTAGLAEAIASAPPTWRREVGIELASDGTPSGEFLSLSGPPKGPGLAHYSAALAWNVRRLHAFLREGPGKVFIYAHRKKTYGVFLIREVLRANGLIGEGEDPTDSTLCSICGEAMRDHGGRSPPLKPPRGKSGKTPKSGKTGGAPPSVAHDFMAARFALAFRDPTEPTGVDRTLGRFNAPNNSRGEAVRVLVGSVVMQEGKNVKGGRLLLVTTPPDDIASLVQVFGRLVRRDSHIALPPQFRDVEVRLAVGVYRAGGDSTPLEVRYAVQMLDYLEIQKVEREHHTAAVGAPSGGPVREATLEALPFSPLGVPPPLRGQDLSLSTFEARGYGDAEVRAAAVQIKRLFRAQSAWTYGRLWAAVHKDAPLLDPGNFALALGFLSAPDRSRRPLGDTTAAALLLDPAERRFPGVNGDIRRVVAVQQPGAAVYLSVPATGGPDGGPLVDTDAQWRSHGAVPNSDTRHRALPAPLDLDVIQYVQQVRGRLNVRAQARRFAEELAGPTPPAPLEIMLGRPAEFQYALLRAIIAASWATRSAPTGGDSLFLSGMELRGLKEARSALLSMETVYRRFDLFVTAGDIMRRPEARALYRGNLKPNDRDRPIGFATPTVALVYVVGSSKADPRRPGGSRAQWHELPLAVVGRGDQRYRENSIAVGFMEGRAGRALDFKIRPPLDATGDARDLRELQRGAVCHTRPKKDQIELAQKLKLSGAVGKLSGERLCRQIRDELLKREAQARRRNGDKTRWFYLFNDRRPSLAQIAAMAATD